MTLTAQQWKDAVDAWIAAHPDDELPMITFHDHPDGSRHAGRTCGTCEAPEPFADTYAYDYRAEQDYPFVTVYDAAPPFSVIERHVPYRDAFSRYGDERWPEPRPVRRARVAIDDVSQAQVVKAYLPTRYHLTDVYDDHVIIEGEDYAGWTLDGYVIPRLASGLFFATEIEGGEDNA